MSASIPVTNDAVNHPAHYTAGEIECIDAIAAALGPEGFRAYCRGHVIKYTWRATHKGARWRTTRRPRGISAG